MPDWQSPEELLKDATAFMKLTHALLGLYSYEFFLSLDFEWDFISGRKKFRWPMLFYFANRYLLFSSLIGIAIALDTTKELNCQVLYGFNQLSGSAAIGLSSINLSIRTIAVWSQDRYIIGLLILVILGHWSLILQGGQLTSTWVPDVGCVITRTNTKIFVATFIYSMCFDLLVLCLNAYKLVGINRKNFANGLRYSRIAQMVFKDGMIFFMIAFLANLIATVFMAMNLNSIMAIIFDVPAGVFSTIVATRAVRRLTNFANQDSYTQSISGSIAFRAVPHPDGCSMEVPKIQSFRYTPNGGVHIKMDTSTSTDQGGHESIYGTPT